MLGNPNKTVTHYHAHGHNYYGLIRIMVVNLVGGRNVERTVDARPSPERCRK